MLNNRQLKSLLKIMRANGVVSLEQDGLKILLDPHFQPAQKVTKGKSQPAPTLQEQIDKAIPALTDEEWLLATNPAAEDEEAA